MLYLLPGPGVPPQLSPAASTSIRSKAKPHILLQSLVYNNSVYSNQYFVFNIGHKSYILVAIQHPPNIPKSPEVQYIVAQKKFNNKNYIYIKKQRKLQKCTDIPKESLNQLTKKSPSNIIAHSQQDKRKTRLMPYINIIRKLST